MSHGNFPDPDTIVHAVGARPNFIKMAPLIDALARAGAGRQIVVHTGQHYDRRMSEEILDDLGFPPPDYSLGVGSGSHGEQTGKVLIEFERILLEHRPGVVVVAGDVNSTLACALAAAKLGIPVAHLESGLRSGDWTMPEEINRVLTDRLSDLLLTHSPEAADNLAARGHRPGARALRRQHDDRLAAPLRAPGARARRLAAPRRGGGRVRARHAAPALERRRPRAPRRDRRRALRARGAGADRLPGAPAHPRAARGRAALERLEAAGVRCIDPVGYLDFLSLQAGAGAIVTDSGGVQEEASALGVPCYTLRANTERPVTISHGTNVLLGDDPARLLDVGSRRPRRRPAPSRCGTATPPSARPTPSSPSTRRSCAPLTAGGGMTGARRGPRLRHRPARHGATRSRPSSR